MKKNPYLVLWIIGACTFLLLLGSVQAMGEGNTNKVDYLDNTSGPPTAATLFSPVLTWCPPCLCPQQRLCPACVCPKVFCPKCPIISRTCPPVTTVFLVRHAEKNVYAPGEPLSDLGISRASELNHTLSNANIVAVYSSNTLRTKQTVKNLSDYLHLTPIIYSRNSDITSDVLSHYPGQTVLIAGHSGEGGEGSVWSIIDSFGGDHSACLIDDAYDNLCMLTLQNDGTVKVIHTHYGAAS